MKTLIIHPKDKTTTFLRHIYRNLDSYTLLKTGSIRDVNSQIIKHDRIFMLGHGTSNGLLSVGQFNGQYVIDESVVPLLFEKECVFIWCNADEFVERHSLKGLYSGMFVSEVIEALMMGLSPVSQKSVTQSNNYFAKVLGQELRVNLSDTYLKMMNMYQIFAMNNIVAQYNVERLHFKD